MTDAHSRRIYDELLAAGVSRFGMKKFAARYLPKVIHKDEHIKGVVYGRYRDKSGVLSLNAGMLVATNKRIIFLDHKPGYTATDEIAYNVVAGISLTKAIFSAVTLRTRLGDYTIRFTNPKSAEIFAKYVERHCL